ncbi:MAG: serine acetyltransferase [Candidatus Cloacimonetes bacterium]|nr:serine acetyltransferase [Candidatus Cloacimonadota bacterium]MDY0230570.1 serine O-acetyltransferase EpsC [Candidatus Cloacimonadaceae bacterium]
MTPKDISFSIKKAADALVSELKNTSVARHPLQKDSMPSLNELKHVMSLLKCILFPGYLGDVSIREDLMESYYELEFEKLFDLLREQVKRGFMYDRILSQKETVASIVEQSEQVALQFIQGLPEIKQLLNTDVIAAYNGDPAARNFGEVIYCYPVISALIHHRVAHLLLELGVPLIPRIISEMAHSETGIDIHPGASIGRYFTIDHGTGVVIGETSIIGNNVKIYQGVTLGAKSFPLDENGQPVKGILRHPIVEDDVIIYANATVLGRVTIGKGAVVGANVSITEDVARGLKVQKS